MIFFHDKLSLKSVPPETRLIFFISKFFFLVFLVHWSENSFKSFLRVKYKRNRSRIHLNGMLIILKGIPSERWEEKRRLKKGLELSKCRIKNRQIRKWNIFMRFSHFHHRQVQFTELYFDCSKQTNEKCAFLSSFPLRFSLYFRNELTLSPRQQ